MEEPKCNVTEVIRALRESKELGKNEMDADFWIESKERDVEYRRLQEEEQPNQKIDTNVFYNSFQRVEHQPPKASENEMQKLVNEYKIQSKSKKHKAKLQKINYLRIGMTQFSANPIVPKKDFKVTEMQFKTSENQISGTSITSELVMAKKKNGQNLLLLGDLKGNHFKIALRNVIGGQCRIETCLHSLRQSGFLNFFSLDFGLENSYLIGKELVLERWQKAIDLILEKWLIYKKPSNLALACFVYTSSRDVLKAVSMIDEHEMDSVPARLLFSIKQHGENLAEALNAVRFETRKSCVHAYLGFIWNKIVSRRIAKFSLKLIIGDLVYDPQHNQVIFIDDGNIRKYTIYDVVLPLPGPDIIYPANEIAGWYDDLFKADGLTKNDFNRNSKIYGLDGVYRFLIIRPSDLKWKFVRYKEKETKFICSDPERLNSYGKFRGLVLEFNLPTFAFASMALREMLKMNMEITYEEKQLDRILKRSLAASEIIINQPQIQKTDENPCRITAPTPETNNFFLGSRPASAISELCQSSSLRKINPESYTLDKQPSMDSPVEELIPCPPSINESPQKESPLEKMDTIKNLQPATKKRSNRSHPYPHPPSMYMITKAVIALKELNGSSRQAILKYILANFHVGTVSKSAKSRLNHALNRGVTLGTLEYIRGAKGAAGSFRLSAEALKPQKVDKKVKPVAADKEPKMVNKDACPKKTKAVSKKTTIAATRKQTKETQVKKGSTVNEQPAAITKDSSEDPQKIKNQTPLREPFKSQECPAAKDDNLCRIDEKPVSEINNSVLHSPSPLRKIKLESGTLDKPPSMDSLVEQPIPCPPSTSECQPKENMLEKTDTIQNLQPATKKPFEEPQVKKEPTENVQPASVTKNSSEELQNNRIIVDCSTSNQMNQLTVNECLKEPLTKYIKQELGIRRTRSSTFIESCDEKPTKKKIKADPDTSDTKQKEFPSKVSNFKSIVHIDLSSDEDD